MSKKYKFFGGVLLLFALVSMAMAQPRFFEIFGNVGTTDNAVVRADGTQSKSVQGSLASVNDSGHMNAVRYTLGGDATAHLSSPFAGAIAVTGTLGGSGAVWVGGSTINIVSDSAILNAGAATDAAIKRVAAATWSAEGTSSAIGFIRQGCIVTNDTNGGSLASADVRGQIYTNTGASGGQTFNLPAAVAGMHVTFLLSAADDVNINPDDADQILVLTNAAGDAISSDATAGSRIELVAIDSTNWMVLDSAGTWSDVN